MGLTSETSEQRIEEVAGLKTTRKLEGWQFKLLYTLGIATSLFHLWVNSLGVMNIIHQNAIHMALMIGMTFLLYPGWRKSSQSRFSPADVLFALLAAVAGFYVFFFQMNIHLLQFSVPNSRDILFATIGFLIIFEAVRRSIGWFIPILCLIFVGYALWFGPHVPGDFFFRGVTFERFMYRMFYTDEGFFGMTARVSSTFVFIFILFGAFLVKSGAGDFMINVARAIAGRLTGGPAHIAILGSGMMGSITGSAVANTVSTGSLTIPLMKRTGYQPHVAAGIEAAASTGGAIMPPIMGAGAMVMAQWTGIPYITIIAVSVIPAIMYYLSIGFFAYVQARKENIRALEAHEVPQLGEVLRTGWQFVLPIGLLVGLLMSGYTPTYAGVAGILAIVAASWFRRETRMYPKDILDALYLGARNSVGTAGILIIAGVIMGVSGITALAINFSGLILALSGGVLFYAILLIAGASLLLGMGLPVTASYIFLAILAAPALTQLGISLLAAHLIIYWYSQDSNVTPPICLAAFAGAGVAGADPMRTGFKAWQIAKGLYLIPIMFAYTPILFQSHWTEALGTAVLGTLGLFAFVSLFEGYFMQAVNYLERALLAVATIGLLWPASWQTWVGFFALVAFLLSHLLVTAKQTPSVTRHA